LTIVFYHAVTPAELLPTIMLQKEQDAKEFIYMELPEIGEIVTTSRALETVQAFYARLSGGANRGDPRKIQRLEIRRMLMFAG